MGTHRRLQPTDPVDRRGAERVARPSSVFFSAGRIEGSGILADLSSTGARIEEVSARLRPGTPVAMTLELHGEGFTFEVKGRVARETESGFAVEFQLDPDPSVEALMRWILARPGRLRAVSPTKKKGDTVPEARTSQRDAPGAAGAGARREVASRKRRARTQGATKREARSTEPAQPDPPPTMHSPRDVPRDAELPFADPLSDDELQFEALFADRDASETPPPEPPLHRSVELERGTNEEPVELVAPRPSAETAEPPREVSDDEELPVARTSLPPRPVLRERIRGSGDTAREARRAAATPTRRTRPAPVHETDGIAMVEAKPDHWGDVVEAVSGLLEDPEKGGAARAVQWSIRLLILLNLGAVALESVDSLRLGHAALFGGFAVFSLSAFALEYLVRLTVCTAKPLHADALAGRLRWAATPLAMADLLAFGPALLGFGPDLRFLRALRLLEVLREPRLGRAGLEIVGALRSSAGRLGVLLLGWSIVLVLAAFALYLAENGVQPQGFRSIPQTLWWTLLTLTTVGHGGIWPITPLGRVIAGGTAVCGMLSLALGAGILASSFLSRLGATASRRPGSGEES